MIAAACAAMCGMAAFEEAAIDDSYLDNVREDSRFVYSLKA